VKRVKRAALVQTVDLIAANDLINAARALVTWKKGGTEAASGELGVE